MGVSSGVGDHFESPQDAEQFLICLQRIWKIMIVINMHLHTHACMPAASRAAAGRAAAGSAAGGSSGGPLGSPGPGLLPPVALLAAALPAEP